MSALDKVVQLIITRITSTLNRSGFGVPMLAAYHTHYADLVRTYSSLAGMVLDGFSDGSTDPVEPAYEIAAAIFSQSPRPGIIKIGRRSRPFTQVIRLTPSDPDGVAGIVYAVTIDGQVVSYTSVLYDTLADVCTGIANAIVIAAPILDITPVAGTDDVTCTADTIGVLHSYDSLTSTSVSSADLTTNPGSGGIAADLSAINAADPDWYGILLDSNSPAEILAAAQWNRANKRALFVAQTADSDVPDTAYTVGGTDIGSRMHALNLFWNGLYYQPRIGVQWPAAAWMARRFTSQPGSDTWAMNSLVGVTATNLTDTQQDHLWGTVSGSTRTVGKCVNATIDIQGTTNTWPGKDSGGEWLDVSRFIDWLFARIGEDFFAMLRLYNANDKKVPFTQKGINLCRDTVQCSLNVGVKVGGLTDDPAPVTTAPLIADVSDADKAARVLPGIEFNADVAGAIHMAQIHGYVAE